MHERRDSEDGCAPPPRACQPQPLRDDRVGDRLNAASTCGSPHKGWRLTRVLSTCECMRPAVAALAKHPPPKAYTSPDVRVGARTSAIAPPLHNTDARVLFARPFPQAPLERWPSP